MRRSRRCFTSNARRDKRSVPCRTAFVWHSGDRLLVETLLERGTRGDVAEAEAAIDRLAAARVDEGLVIRDVWLLRLRALLARARGDEATCRDYRERYRATAASLGFEGHIAWAETMP